MLPEYYSNLAPFRARFLAGRPVLTYHHVGHRPRRACIKGLYLSPTLFTRQIAELRREGFSTASFGSLTAPYSSTKVVFLTFDDGFRDVFENALPILTEHRCHAILFLVAGLLGQTNQWQQSAGDIVEGLMDETQVRTWLASGQEIGSHTLTHPRLTQLSSNAARQEITDSKKSLEDQFGVAIDHFCYPYGDWNLNVRDLVVEAGYKSACTTNPGLNNDGTSPFSLNRFTARYRSRNLRNLWTRTRLLMRQVLDDLVTAA